MSKFNRKKFRGSKIANLKAQQDELNAKQPKKAGGNKSNFLSLEEGKNRVRIYPAHPDTKTGHFTFPRKTHFLPIEVTYTKDGNEVTEIKRKPIFNSIVHGKDVSKDIIEEYIKFARDIAYNEIDDEKERKKFLKPIEDFKTGMKPQTRWIVYAELTTPDGTTEFGRLDLPTSVKDAMNTIAIANDDPEEVIDTDPFTCPDEGRAIFITYDKQSEVPQAQRDPKKYYQVALDWKRAATLSDEALEKFMDEKPLEEIFHESYTRKDFEMALEGLRRFDSEERKELGETSFSFFDYDEWNEIVEELSGYFPEVDEDGDEEDEKPTRKSTRQSKKNDDVEEEDSDMPWDKELEDMDRSELKGVVRREGLGIRITAAMSDEELVDAIVDARADKAGSTESKASDDEEEEEEEAPRRRSSRRSRRNIDLED